MGEVYKARDTRLDRTVAVKVARQRFSERFEREARTISALNHPHICQLYDVGPDYLVMEYIEGKPVTGPMPVAEALRLSVEIAEALAAAHGKGIVHRDLKPDNILITRSGVKLLDFGLAKVAGRPAPSDETVTRALTQEGTIVGTLQYMSPEQLQGEEADARSDIFSFGAVLYEMLTGRRAFAGKNQASIITAIMSADPPAISGGIAGPVASPAIERVVRRCLTKDPAARWQSARDLGEELKWIAEGGSAAGVAEGALAGPARGSRVAWVLSGVLAIALAAVSFYAVEKRDSPQVVRLEFETPHHSNSRASSAPMLSPDGERVAFTEPDEKGVPHIWVRSISSFQARDLPGTEGSSTPFWSPDGKHIGFLAGGRLVTIDPAGGTPQLVADLGRDLWFASIGSWSPGGVILFDKGAELMQVSAQGGEPRPATRLDASRGEFMHLWPQFLPDGRHFQYLAVSQRAENSGIYVGSLDSPQTRRVLASGLGAVFSEPGYLLYVRSGTLVAHPFDWKSARLTGDPISLSEPVFAWATSFFPVSSFSVAGNTLAYRSGGLPPMKLTWFDRQGRRLGDFAEPGQYTGPALSPDGQRVVVGIADPRTNLRDLWLLDGRGGNLRLTFDPKDDFNPVWSPDGTRIAFSSDRKGVRDVYIQQVNGQEEELLVGSQSQKSVEDWSPDGKLVLYNADGAVWAVPVEGEHKLFPVVQGPARYDQCKISPDGKWVAYRSTESGRYEIFVQAFPVPGPRWQISTTGGWEPSWRRDGKELYFTIGNRFMAVDVKALAGGFEHGTPHPLFEAPFTPEVRRNRYLPAVDGQKFLAVIVGEEGASKPIRVVLNWNAELKR